MSCHSTVVIISTFPIRKSQKLSLGLLTLPKTLSQAKFNIKRTHPVIDSTQTTISTTNHISSKQNPFSSWLLFPVPLTFPQSKFHSSFYIPYQVGRLPSKFNSRPSNEPIRTSPKLSLGPLPQSETLFGSRIQQTKNTLPVLDCTHTTASTTSLPLTFSPSKQNPFPARIVSHHLNFCKSIFIPPHYIPNKRVPIYYHHCDHDSKKNSTNNETATPFHKIKLAKNLTRNKIRSPNAEWFEKNRAVTSWARTE